MTQPNIPTSSINAILQFHHLLFLIILIIPNSTSLITKPINFSKKPHYIKAKSMIRFNIEITNKAHPFYTDICFPFSTIQSTDISLPLRDHLYYTDPSQYYCDKGCLFDSLDYAKGDSICDCSDDDSIDNTTTLTLPWPRGDNGNDKGITFTDVFSFSNVNLMKCYSLVFNADIFSNNFGYWLIFILIIIELMIFAVFIKDELKPLLNYLAEWYDKVLNQNKAIASDTNSNSNASPTPTPNSNSNIHSPNHCPFHHPNQIHNHHHQHQQRNDCDIHNEYTDDYKDQPQSSCRLHLKPDPDFNEFNDANLIANSDLQRMAFSPTPQSNNKGKTKPKLKAKPKAKLQNKDDTPNVLKHHSLFKQNIQTKTEELNSLEFSKAILFDKRSYKQHYLSILLSYHPILSTFLTNNYKRIQIIKLSAFFLSITMLLIFNALFFSENYIDNSYYSNGAYNFLYHFPKSIVAYLFTMLLLPLYDTFAYYDSGIREIKDMTCPSSILIKIKKFIRCYKIKVYLYFGLQFVSILIGWYYVTAFCSVYRNNQVHLFLSFIVSFGLSMIMPFATSAIVACMRYYSIKKKWQCLHKYSVILI